MHHGGAAPQRGAEQAATKNFLSKGLGEDYRLLRRQEVKGYPGNLG
jgi:hypothetical protein